MAIQFAQVTGVWLLFLLVGLRWKSIESPGRALEAFLEAREKGKGVTGHQDPDILTRLDEFLAPFLQKNRRK